MTLSANDANDFLPLSFLFFYCSSAVSQTETGDKIKLFSRWQHFSSVALIRFKIYFGQSWNSFSLLQVQHLSLLSLVPDILFLRVRNAASNTFLFYMIIFFHSYVTAYSLQHQSLQDLSLSDGADIYICPLSMEEEWSWPRLHCRCHTFRLEG